MADPELWLHVVAAIGAIYEIVQYGAEYSVAFARRMASPESAKDAETLGKVFSTYSNMEVEALEKRVLRCRDRFVEEGSGEGRVRCMCSVLRDIKDGNGGEFPLEEWRKLFQQLKCEG